MLALLLGLLQIGCGSYRLQGIVLEGTSPGVEIVGKDDPRLERFGVPDASLQLMLDPERLSPEQIGQGRTNRDGRFSLPISETGAGFLMLDVELIVRRDEFRSVRDRFELPGGGKRLIVTLERGRDVRSLEDDNILESTLRDAEPYLRD